MTVIAYTCTRVHHYGCCSVCGFRTQCTLITAAAATAVYGHTRLSTSDAEAAGDVDLMQVLYNLIRRDELKN